MSATAAVYAVDLHSGLTSVLPLVATDKDLGDLCRVRLNVQGSTLVLQSTDRYRGALWVGELSTEALDGLETLLDVEVVKDVLAMLKSGVKTGDVILTLSDTLLTFKMSSSDHSVGALVEMPRFFPRLESLIQRALADDPREGYVTAWGKPMLSKLIKAFGAKARLSFRASRERSGLVVVTSQDHPRLVVVAMPLNEKGQDIIEDNRAVQYLRSYSD